MKLRIRFPVLIAVGLAVAAGAWIYSGQMEPDPFAVEKKEAERAPAADTTEATLPHVRVAQSKAEPHRAIMLYTGKTEAERRAVIRAETEGRVVEVAAEKSAPIEKGALIVKLASNDRFAKLNQAQALVRQREIEFKAAQKLAGKGYQTESARAEAEANLSSAKAALEQIRVDIARITIEAPFSGVLQDRAVEVGDFVQPGMEIATLADLDPLVVTVQVAEKEIARVEMGAIAKVELISGTQMDAIVSRIATAADPLTRTFEVELEVTNPDTRLLDGMTAKVFLPAQQVMAHKISPALLTLGPDGSVGVKTVTPDNRVAFHPISIVEDQADGIWIGGLPNEVTLITVGQSYVAEGAEVMPVAGELSGKALPAADEPKAISEATAEGERS